CGVDRPLMTINGHDETAIDAMNIDLQHASVDINFVTHVSVSPRPAPALSTDGHFPLMSRRYPPPLLAVTTPPGAPQPSPQPSRLPLRLRRTTCRSGRTILRRDTTCGTRRGRIRAASAATRKRGSWF